jgi:hypothetical protein
LRRYLEDKENNSSAKNTSKKGSVKKESARKQKYLDN